MARFKGSKHAVAVRRAASELTSPVARSLLFQSTGVFDSDYSDARTEHFKFLAPTIALSRAQERVPTVSETQSIVRLGPEWVEVSTPRRSLEAEQIGRRMRQIMLERMFTQRAENVKQLRKLTRFVTPGVFGMTLVCLERRMRREALFARARLDRMEGVGNGRPRPRKRHWRRSWASAIGC